jgi:hypothetical protein
VHFDGERWELATLTWSARSCKPARRKRVGGAYRDSSPCYRRERAALAKLSPFESQGLALECHIACPRKHAGLGVSVAEEASIFVSGTNAIRSPEKDNQRCDPGLVLTGRRNRSDRRRAESGQRPARRGAHPESRPQGVVDDRVAGYGQLIVDECHHLSAFSFEQVARCAKARLVAGPSATVARKTATIRSSSCTAARSATG